MITERVVVDGYESKYARVISGVSQSTVLGPVMFLLYINDINNNISSLLRLFADDCIMYRTIKSEQDHLQLQQDLHTVYNGHKNGKFALISANVLHLDVTECYLHLYLHMSSMISLYLVLTNIPILVLL